MFCHKCGAYNREEAIFCKKCGTKLVKVSVNEKQPSLTTKTPVSITTNNIIEKTAEHKPVYNFRLPKIKYDKIKLKYFAIGVIILVLVITPEVKAYYGYYKGIREANKSFAVANYEKAIKNLESIQQHGLYKKVRHHPQAGGLMSRIASKAIGAIFS